VDPFPNLFVGIDWVILVHFGYQILEQGDRKINVRTPDDEQCGRFYIHDLKFFRKQGSLFSYVWTFRVIKEEVIEQCRLGSTEGGSMNLGLSDFNRIVIYLA
jgi:hypothetical protein